MSSVSGSFEQPMRIAPETDESRDTDLFRRSQTGDRGAFGQLAIRLQDRLYNSILRVVGDREEARELTQETFTRALASIETFRGEAQPYTWLFRIGINLAISHLRKIQRRRTFSLDAVSPTRAGGDQATALVDRLSREQPSPSDRMEKREAQQQVLTALGRLDVEYRAIVVMRDIDGMDYQQMADTLNLPLGTLKSRLFRARLSLREQLIEVMKEGDRSQKTGDRR
ncbi:MAG: sigma-70 family RNA polymerase sigma factor [Burkholderiales bacterium]|nr:sigma-70 family RNA polymerase sigma factor [Phycisphaerae bacterium]